MANKYPYDEKEIIGATGNIYKGTVDGKPAWSNGEMLEIGTDNPFKIIKRIAWNKRKPDLQKLITERTTKHPDVFISRSIPIEVPMPIHLTDKDCYKCHNLEAETFYSAIIQDKYYYYFKAHYPRCRFGLSKLHSAFSPVTVYTRNKQLVGLIMPMLY